MFSMISAAKRMFLVFLGDFAAWREEKSVWSSLRSLRLRGEKELAPFGREVNRDASLMVWLSRHGEKKRNENIRFLRSCVRPPA